MTRRGLEVRVGLLVVIAATVAVVGTMWFQRFQLMESRYPFFVRFDEVGGLVAGDPIHVNGVERGKVQSVDLEHAHEVVVEMGLAEGLTLPDDSRIVLKSIGIMGERFVAITRGRSSRAVAPGDTLDGEFLMGLSEVMGSAGDILTDIEEVAQSLREVAEILSGQGRLQETMDNLAEASESVRDLTTGEDADIANAANRLSHAAALVDSLMSTHYTSLDSSMAAVGRAGTRFETTVENLTAASDDLKSITASLRETESTVGRLLHDDELINRLESTIGRVDSLVLDMKLHPGRYVTFKLF